MLDHSVLPSKVSNITKRYCTIFTSFQIKTSFSPLLYGPSKFKVFMVSPKSEEFLQRWVSSFNPSFPFQKCFPVSLQPGIKKTQDFMVPWVNLINFFSEQRHVPVIWNSFLIEMYTSWLMQTSSFKFVPVFFITLEWASSELYEGRRRSDGVWYSADSREHAMSASPFNS
jgi:hypothetical protein